jgi:hypothetical protein
VTNRLAYQGKKTYRIGSCCCDGGRIIFKKKEISFSSIPLSMVPALSAEKFNPKRNFTDDDLQQMDKWNKLLFVGNSVGNVDEMSSLSKCP